MITLVDPNKTGTLILSYYRNGTHFLQNVITDSNPGVMQFGEICNDNTLKQLEEITRFPKYKVCIFNNTEPKFFLSSNLHLLNEWHVIHLTRNDKVQHFISHWFWNQNTLEERLQDSGKFSHHGTGIEVYQKAIQGQRVKYDISAVIVWLQEQLINYVLPSNARLDYRDLPEYQTENIRWCPNKYDAIKLHDIFVNYEEINYLLQNYKII